MEQVLNEAACTAAETYNLSKRGAFNSVNRDIWGPREKSMANPWSPQNPEGSVIMRLAENSLMHTEVADLIASKIKTVPSRHLTYSTGPKGSRRLRDLAAKYLSDELGARSNPTADNIFILPGLGSAIDALAWSICDDGDAILIPQPYYNGFEWDLANRSNVRIVGVSYSGLSHKLEDIFQPDINEIALEEALRRAKSIKIRVRALMISNPHNPLGRCYPSETLRVFASFCGTHGLHFISDEIYAKSTFSNHLHHDPVPFTSVLAINMEDSIRPDMMHVLYGASKDFCANGLRIGFICTHNVGVMGAISSISQFSWSPHLLQDVWAAMLDDKQWLDDFMLTKSKLMEKNYKFATSFLREHNIAYFEADAGVFIWVDLRQFLKRPVESEQEAEQTVSLEFERAFEAICIKNKVMIAPGHAYNAEEPGFFRITFTIEPDALAVGLSRLAQSLSDMKKERSMLNVHPIT